MDGWMDGFGPNEHFAPALIVCQCSGLVPTSEHTFAIWIVVLCFYILGTRLTVHLRPKQILNSCKTKCFLHFYCSTTVIDEETPPEKHIYTHMSYHIHQIQFWPFGEWNELMGGTERTGKWQQSNSATPSERRGRQVEQKEERKASVHRIYSEKCPCLAPLPWKHKSEQSTRDSSHRDDSTGGRWGMYLLKSWTVRGRMGGKRSAYWSLSGF